MYHESYMHNVSCQVSRRVIRAKHYHTWHGMSCVTRSCYLCTSSCIGIYDAAYLGLSALLRVSCFMSECVIRHVHRHPFFWICWELIYFILVIEILILIHRVWTITSFVCMVPDFTWDEFKWIKPRAKAAYTCNVSVQSVRVLLLNLVVHTPNSPLLHGSLI